MATGSLLPESGCQPLEALGVKIDISPEQSKQLLTDINICFLFAQK